MTPSHDVSTINIFLVLLLILLLLLLLLSLFSPLAQIRRHDTIEVREMCNGCNGVSFGNHGVLEGDRIPSLKSHGKALEQESGFPPITFVLFLYH